MLTIGDQLGRYRLTKELGRGGMGVVFLAEDIRMQRRVAIKLLNEQLAGSPPFRARFMREMRIAARLEHPNVLPVYETGEDGGHLFIAMRYVDGSDLGRMCAGTGVAPDLVARLATMIGAALDGAHATGLVHRDVKPANVLVAGNGENMLAYLTDFGLSRDLVSESGLTHTGEWMGTADYVSPEQAAGGPTSARSDIYSFGCLLYHALSGRPPFQGELLAKLYCHRYEPFPSVGSALSHHGEIDRVLSRAAAKEPADRHASAGDVARDLWGAITNTDVGLEERVIATGAARTGIATRDGARFDVQPTEHDPPPESQTLPQRTDRRRVSAEDGDPRRRRVRSGTPLAVAAVVVTVAVAAIALLILRGSVGSGNRTGTAAEAAKQSRPASLPQGATVATPAQGIGGKLWSESFFGGSWHGPLKLPAAGKLASAPTVAVHDGGEQDVFWKGTDGNLWEISHAATWGQPLLLGAGPLGSAPTAGADRAGNVYVFWEGTDRSLWGTSLTGGRWSGPGRVNGTGALGSPPAVAVRADGQQDVFWKGTDGNLWEISDVHGWGRPVNLGAGPLGSAPTAGADGQGNEYVFWRGTNGTLWDRWFVNGAWHGPGPITSAGHNLASAPSVAVHASSEQDVFWKGTDGNLWETFYFGQWHRAQDLAGGPLGSGPAAGVDGSGVQSVFWQGLLPGR